MHTEHAPVGSSWKPASKHVPVACSVLGLFLVATTACRSRLDNSAFSRPVYAAQPWQLSIRVSPEEMPVGRKVILEFTLTNVSDAVAPGCVGSWSYYFRGSGPALGQVSGTVDGCCMPNGEFLLPPQHHLVWSDEVEVPQVGEGNAEIVAQLVICHPYWFVTKQGQGAWQVSSRSVPFRVLASKGSAT